MEKKWLFDQDGIVADFASAALALHGRSPANVYTGDNLGKWDFIPLLGISDEAFWEPINNFDFWATLPKTVEADRMVEAACRLFGAKNVGFLTAPSNSGECFMGKRAWVKSHWPELQHQIIFAPPTTKAFIASPDRFLVDDKDENVDQFRAAGGNAILMPRLWNKQYSRVSTDNSDYIIACMHAWKAQR